MPWITGPFGPFEMPDPVPQPSEHEPLYDHRYVMTPDDLARIAEIPVDGDHIADLRSKRIKFFDHIGDKANRLMLIDAAIADIADRKPEGLLPYDTPFVADIEDRIQYLIGDDQC